MDTTYSLVDGVQLSYGLPRLGAVLPNMSGIAKFAPFFSNGIAKFTRINQLFLQARVICRLRDIVWMIDSIEQLIRRRSAKVLPMADAKIGKDICRNNYGRSEVQADTARRLIAMTWGSLHRVWLSERAWKVDQWPSRNHDIDLMDHNIYCVKNEDFRTGVRYGLAGHRYELGIHLRKYGPSPCFDVTNLHAEYSPL